MGGYIARLVARQQADLSAYITSLVLVIMAPNFLALVSYYASGKVRPDVVQCCRGITDHTPPLRVCACLLLALLTT